MSEPERRLSENILTVADFVQTLNAEIDSLLGVPDDSSCIVESSAIQYAASDSECTALFTAAQLVGVSFCYRFQTTISPPTSGEDCEVNAAAQLVAAALIGGDFADAIGPAADIVELSVPTNSPTSAPTEGPTSLTFPPTSETFPPTSETGGTTFVPTSETEGPTSDLDARTASVNTCGNDGSPKSICKYRIQFEAAAYNSYFDFTHTCNKFIIPCQSCCCYSGLCLLDGQF